MEAAKGKPTVSPITEATKSRQLTDPVVIGIAAGVLGYVMGSGQWDFVRQRAGKVAKSLGSLTMFYLYDSFKKHNPQLFSEQNRVTH